jgi:cytochrome c oxidase assembly protein subunit 15
MTQVNSIAPAALARLHRYAIVCVVATLCLIFIGGLVTSTGSALAVPDWPLAFGKLIPRLEGGVRFEYGHRVAAGLVAMLTLGLAALAGWTTPPSRVRTLTMVAVGIVIIQVILGGITVRYGLPLAIAVAHAATAQAFFCLIVAITALTNLQFAAPRAVALALPDPLPKLAVITTATIYLQILIGAVMRHLGAGLAIPDFPLSYGRLIPPLDSGFVMINFAHRCGALVVAILVVATVFRAMRAGRSEPLIRRPAHLLGVLLVVQITLGAMTVWSGRAVLPTTAHVATGAAVLATSLWLTLRLYGLRASLAATEPARLRGAGATIAGHEARA